MPHQPSAVLRAVGVTGELMITAGVLVLLYVAYTLWGTGLETARAQDRLREATVRAWSAPTPQPSPTTEGPAPEPPRQVGYALLRMPTLGDDEWVVVDDVSMRKLAQGPGHYPGTAAPGQVGNFALAGHRSGHLAPFKHIDDLEPGDPVEVETRDGVWTYTVTGSRVVEPTDVWVLDPVPGQARVKPTTSRLTLTTCEPIYVATHRLVVFAELESGPGGAPDSKEA